jgi:PIN domain nuclease of toxin-antitoxin system
LLPLTPKIAVETSYLPGALHADPADRMLVASARIHHLTLATRDEKILAYAQEGYIRAEAF